MAPVEGLSQVITTAAPAPVSQVTTTPNINIATMNSVVNNVSSNTSTQNAVNAVSPAVPSGMMINQVSVNGQPTFVVMNPPSGAMAKPAQLPGRFH